MAGDVFVCLTPGHFIAGKVFVFNIRTFHRRQCLCLTLGHFIAGKVFVFTTRTSHRRLCVYVFNTRTKCLRLPPVHLITGSVLCVCEHMASNVLCVDDWEIS